MSNSKKKMDVVVTKTEWKNGKRWAKVTLKNGTSFFPSFEDLYRIVQAISYCEDEKYPDGEGRGMVARFLKDAVFTDSWEELAKKYKIPLRCGNLVIETNGADLQEAFDSGRDVERRSNYRDPEY